MEEIKDYVFLAILKNDNMLEEEGMCCGIKRGNSKNHVPYYRAFLEMYPFIHEHLCLSSNWECSMEILARDGNVLIANSAVEIEKIEDRFYLIYLPTFPNIFQLKQLEIALEEFESVEFDVSVYGEDEKIFREFRMKDEFNAVEFLKKYISSHKKRLLNKPTNFYEHSLESRKIYTKV